MLALVQKEKVQKFLFYIFLFIFTFFLLRGNVLNSDDIYFNFLTSPTIELKFDFIYGTWIMALQNFLMYYLPYKLGINLQAWALSFGVLFETSIIVFLIAYIMKFSSKNIGNIGYFTFSILSFLLYFILLRDKHYVDLLLYSGFFRFILPSLLLVIFAHTLYKFFKDEKVNIVYLLIIAFLTSSSFEIVSALIMATCILVFFAKLIYLKRNKITLNYKFYLKWLAVFGSSLSGFLFLFFSTGFQRHLNMKTSSLISFDEFLELFIPFSRFFFSEIIVKYWYLYVLFILICTFLLIKHNSLKTFYVVSYSLISIISLYTVYFSLILLGKTSYHQNFWLDHDDIYCSFITLLIFVLVALLSYFVEVFSVRKKLVLLFIGIITLSLTYPFFICIKDLRSSIETISEYSYIRDKIRLFYSYKKTKPYSSLYLFSRPAWILTRFFPFEESDILIEDAKNIFDNNYYPICYKHNITSHKTDYTFLEFGELKKKFEADGGTLQEVYFLDYDFKKLSDKDFVLNSSKF